MTAKTKLNKTKRCSYFVELFAEAKVCEDDMAVGVQENVLQLQVPVDDPQLSAKERLKGRF